MKYYVIQVKFTKSDWTTIHKEQLHKEALAYVADQVTTKYPLRIVRVEETVVFEGK